MKKKQLEYTIIKESDNHYYFFDKSGIYRKIDKNNEKAKILVRGNIKTIIERLSNNKIEDDRVEELLIRLRVGESIKTLERYLNPEEHLAYRVLKESENDDLYYYFDNKGVFTASPYITPLMFPIEPNSFVGYILGLKIEKAEISKAKSRLQVGETIQDLEKIILNERSQKITLPRRKKRWHKKFKLFRVPKKFQRLKKLNYRA